VRKRRADIDGPNRGQAIFAEVSSLRRYRGRVHHKNTKITQRTTKKARKKRSDAKPLRRKEEKTESLLVLNFLGQLRQTAEDFRSAFDGLLERHTLEGMQSIMVDKDTQPGVSTPG
jgi:hypothetical protein